MEINSEEMIALIKVLHPFVAHVGMTNASIVSRHDMVLSDLNRRMETELQEAHAQRLADVQSDKAMPFNGIIPDEDIEDYDFELNIEQLDELSPLRTHEGVMEFAGFVLPPDLVIDGNVLKGVTRIKRYGHSIKVSFNGNWSEFFVKKFPTDWVRTFPLHQIAKVDNQ